MFGANWTTRTANPVISREMYPWRAAPHPSPLVTVLNKDQLQLCNMLAKISETLEPIYSIWKLVSAFILCDPVDYSPPGSSVRGIVQARILEWLPFPPPEDLPNPGIESASYISYVGRRVLYHWCHLGSPFTKQPQMKSPGSFLLCVSG